MSIESIRKKMEDLTPKNAASILEEILELYDQYGIPNQKFSDIRWSSQAAFAYPSVGTVFDSSKFFSALDDVEHPPMKWIDGRPIGTSRSVSISNLMDEFFELVVKSGLDTFNSVWETTLKYVGADPNYEDRIEAVKAMSKFAMTAESAETVNEMGVILMRTAVQFDKFNFSTRTQISKSAELIIRAILKTPFGKEYAETIMSMVTHMRIKAAREPYAYEFQTPQNRYLRLCENLFDLFAFFGQSDRKLVGGYFYLKQHSLTVEQSEVFQCINDSKEYKPSKRYVDCVWEECFDSALFGLFQLQNAVFNDTETLWKEMRRVCDDCHKEM